MSNLSLPAIVELQKQEPGIDPKVLLDTTAEELALLVDLPVQLLSKYTHSLQQEYRPQFITALQYLDQKRTTLSFTTGCDSIDQLFHVDQYQNLGIRKGELYEISGSPGSGKSQICFQLAVTAQLPVEAGGLDQDVIWIDTERSFSPSRVMQIASSIQQRYYCTRDIEELLQGIQLAQVSTSQQQLEAIRQVIDLMDRQPERFGLIVVDGIMSLFRAEFPGQQLLVQRQQQLNYHLHHLSRLAAQYNLAVVVTNQVQTVPDQLQQVQQPVGGHILAHWSHHRIMLRSLRDGVRQASILASSLHPQRQANFTVSSRGIDGPMLGLDI